MIFNQLINLFKLRIGFIMMLTAMVAMAASPGSDSSLWEVTVLALCVLIASASAGAFNQYYESDLDALMKRTKNRPFVTGSLKKGPLWIFIILALLIFSVGAAAYVLNAETAIYIFLGAFFYAIVYTVWLKRRTWMNIVIGGASGSFAVLAGAAAVEPQLGPIPIQLALVLFFWTPSHFWSLAIAVHKDYSSAGIPMLPAVVGNKAAAQIILVNTVLLVSVSILPFFYGMNWVYLLAALTGGLYFIYRNIVMIREPSPGNAMQGFFASLVQLTVLLIGIVLDVMLFN